MVSFTLVKPVFEGSGGVFPPLVVEVVGEVVGAGSGFVGGLHAENAIMLQRTCIRYLYMGLGCDGVGFVCDLPIQEKKGSKTWLVGK